MILRCNWWNRIGSWCLRWPRLCRLRTVPLLAVLIEDWTVLTTCWEEEVVKTGKLTTWFAMILWIATYYSGGCSMSPSGLLGVRRVGLLTRVLAGVVQLSAWWWEQLPRVARCGVHVMCVLGPPYKVKRIDSPWLADMRALVTVS